jgi:hypothetical protein
MSEPFKGFVNNEATPEAVRTTPTIKKSGLLSVKSIAVIREYRPTTRARTNHNLATQVRAFAYAFNTDDAI